MARSISEVLPSFIERTETVVGYEDRGTPPIQRIRVRHISNFPAFIERRARQELHKRGVSSATSRPRSVGQ